jgi:peptide/nickel transport system substrate-binding protein
MRNQVSVKLPAVLGIVALVILTAGCMGSSASNPSSGGTILGAGPFSPDTLDPDPKGIVDEQTNFMMANMYTGVLLSIQPPAGANFTNLKPDLAESVTPLSSGLGYQFKLRSGVKSRYGNPLTSDDVLWSFQRMVNTGGVAAILFFLGNVDTKNPITVTGPLTFTLNLAKPSPLILDMLQISCMGILDKVAVQKNTASSDPWGYDWLSTHDAGFGPYEVSSYTSASDITLVPNPNYYGTKPSITKVVFKQVPDSASRLQLLQGGEINLDWQTTPTEYPTLATNSKLHVYFDHAPLFSRILPNFRPGSGPLTNPLVRKAFQTAIDRKSIANAILPGQATAGTSCVPNAITPKGFSSFTNETADPAAAKQLLTQAGYPNGVTVSIATNYGVTIANLPATVQFLQTELGAAGITLQVHSYPTQAAYIAATQNGGFEALMDTFQPFVGDAGFYMETTLTTNFPVNYGGYSNKAFDALVDQASAMPAGAEREQVLTQACQDAVNDVAFIPLVNLPTLTSTASNVKGVLDYPDLQLHFDKMSIG